MLVAASSKSLAAIASLLSNSVVSAEEVNPRLYCIKTNRFHFDEGFFSKRIKKTSKCGKNISDILACRLEICTYHTDFDVVRL